MNASELLRSLRAADRTLREEGPPPHVDEALQAALRAPPRAAPSARPGEVGSLPRSARGRRWVVLGSFASAAVCVLLVVVLVRDGAEGPTGGGRVATLSSGCVGGAEGLVVAEHACRVVWSDARIVVDAEGGARFRRSVAGAELLAGTARFDVDPRVAGEPRVMVEGAGARIEVLGTRFTVEVHAGRRWVDLEHGRIRLERRDGSVVELSPGEGASLVPEPKAALPVPTTTRAPPPPDEAVAQAPPPQGKEKALPRIPAAPRPPSGEPRSAEPRSAEPRSAEPRSAEPGPSPSPSDDVYGLLRSVRRLRTAGDEDGALRVVEELLASPLDDRLAHSLSYERGELMGRTGADPAARCRHWAHHRARFGLGRFAERIAADERDLGCPRAD